VGLFQSFSNLLPEEIVGGLKKTLFLQASLAKSLPVHAVWISHDNAPSIGAEVDNAEPAHITSHHVKPDCPLMPVIVDASEG